MRMRNFWAQNGPFPQMRIFFKKPVNEPSGQGWGSNKGTELKI